MKSIKKSLGVLLTTGMVALCGCGPKLPELPVADVQPYFGEAAKTKAIDTAYYEVMDAHGELMGTVLLSSPYSDNVKGYNGPTPLLIALDAEGRIKNVVLLKSDETLNFVQHVVEGGLLEAWNGLSVSQALNKDVDAISGATYTSNGIKESLKVRLEKYLQQRK